MSDIVIRPATPDDWRTVVDFNCRLADETENKRLDDRSIAAGVRAVLEDPRKGRYFLACDGQRTVGQLMHTWEWSDWRNGQIWWLQSVYVHPEYRRRGVFRRLFEHLAREARDDRDVVGLRLYVDGGNERAQRTYEQLGLGRTDYHVMEQIFD